MTQPPVEPIERLISEALSARSDVRAPEGFAERVDTRLLYAQLLERQRKSIRQAWAAGVGGVIALAGVTALFAGAVNVPAWAIENVPGVLGRIDAATVQLSQAATPILLMAAGGVAAAAAWGALRLRTRRARG
jgi:hypothetical protein